MISIFSSVKTFAEYHHAPQKASPRVFISIYPYFDFWYSLRKLFSLHLKGKNHWSFMHPVIFGEMLRHEAAHLILTVKEKSEKEIKTCIEEGLQEKHKNQVTQFNKKRKD